MEQIKSSKVVKSFICEKCKYNCRRMCDYKKHILTAKHNLEQMEKIKSSKVVNCFVCDCGKKYKVYSGLWKHKNTCSTINNSINIQENLLQQQFMITIISQNKEIVDALVLQNEELMKKNNELTNAIMQQSSAIKEILPKIGNINVANTINNFNLNIFLNEDCKDAMNFSEFIKHMQVSLTDLENQAENGYIKGITKLFIENLNRLGTNNRPIHCTDKKRRTLYIKENNEWDKEGSQDILKKGIQEVTRRTFEQLIKEQKIHSEEYNDADSEFSMKCISIQRNLTPNHPRETTISKVIDNITQNTGIL